MIRSVEYLFLSSKDFFFLFEKKKTALPGDCNPLEALFVLYTVFIMQGMLGFRGRKKCILSN